MQRHDSRLHVHLGSAEALAFVLLLTGQRCRKSCRPAWQRVWCSTRDTLKLSASESVSCRHINPPRLHRPRQVRGWEGRVAPVPRRRVIPLTVSSPTDAVMGREMLRISEKGLPGSPGTHTSGWGVTRIQPSILKALASTGKRAGPDRGLLLQKPDHLRTFHGSWPRLSFVPTTFT